MSDLLSTLKTRAKPTGKGKLQQDWYLFSQAADLIEQQQKRIAELEQREAELGMSIGHAHQKRAEANAARSELGFSSDDENVSPNDLRESIKYIKQERDELAATVNRLLDITNKAGVALAMLPEGALGEVPDDHERQGWFIRDELIYNLEQALKSTPRQNLSSIKRETAKRAIVEFGLVTDTRLCDENDLIRLGEEYANETYPDKEGE